MKRKKIILFIILFSFTSYSQKNKVDRFRVLCYTDFSIERIKVIGTTDQGSGNETTIDNWSVTTEPIYRHEEKNVFALNLPLKVGFNIPFYRTEKYSVGTQLYVGIGKQYNSNNEMFNGNFLDLSNFYYFRNYKGGRDYTFLIGAKYKLSTLPYGGLIFGYDFNLTNRSSIRIYCMPLRRYFRELTNGAIEPAIKITEIGCGINF